MPLVNASNYSEVEDINLQNVGLMESEWRKFAKAVADICQKRRATPD